ncbi:MULTISPECIES: hypothetical protein [Photorhabdus]|uniref:hypothetical protein n=1 Tax=Photorhabdus TaxID=29487 RepID=UPI001472718E|nr:hypothetical protein [Photorhabdus asymbiotica]
MTGVSECSQQRGNLKDDGYSYLGDIHCDEGNSSGKDIIFYLINYLLSTFIN